ncbi:MAG: lysylphosphatidylglycerol synthase transmembrane domain-containing protein [Saprospiraceae bacterium]|nr:lysylphosphatidylglycerol synthase transmembrane domain-containing protein [Saprospiraceae bacterium]
MDKTLKNLLKTLLFLSVGVIILYIVYLKFNSDFQKECAVLGIPSEDCNFFKTIVSYIKSANYVWVCIALMFYMVSNISRSLRWQMLLEPLSHKPKFLNTLSTVMVGYLVNLGIPRSGEFIRAGLLSQYEKMEAEKVMGTIVTSRVIDVLCLLITIALTLLFSFDNFYNYFAQNSDLSDKFAGLLSTFNLLLLGFISLSFLAVLWKYRAALLATKIGQKVKKIFLGFWEGIVSIKDLKNPVLFVFHTIVIWVCYYLMTYLMFFSFDATTNLAPVAGLVVFVFGTLGIVVPSPGGMGTYQYLISEALMLYGVAFPEAFAFANIMFFSVQLLNVFLGVIGFFFLPIYNRND